MAINILEERRDQVESWLASKGYTIEALVGGDLEQFREVYGITGAPETFLLDSDRSAVFWHVGFQPGEERRLEAEIRVLLGLTPFNDPELE